MQLCSPNVIDCADIQETHGKFHYKKKGVRLKSLKAKENSKIADSLVFMLQYGEIVTASSLGLFDAEIVGGSLNILFTPTNNITTIKLVRTAIIT